MKYCVSVVKPLSNFGIGREAHILLLFIIRDFYFVKTSVGGCAKGIEFTGRTEMTPRMTQRTLHHSWGPQPSREYHSKH